jgi:hypothetical protein
MPFFARLRAKFLLVYETYFLRAAKQRLISPNGTKPMTDIDRKLIMAKADGMADRL